MSWNPLGPRRTWKWGLLRRIEELEWYTKPAVDLVDGLTDDDWQALSILHHDLLHTPGAEITPEEEAEVERRLRAGSSS